MERDDSDALSAMLAAINLQGGRYDNHDLDEVCALLGKKLSMSSDRAQMRSMAELFLKMKLEEVGNHTESTHRSPSTSTPDQRGRSPAARIPKPSPTPARPQYRTSEASNADSQPVSRSRSRSPFGAFPRRGLADDPSQAQREEKKDGDETPGKRTHQGYGLNGRHSPAHDRSDLSPPRSMKPPSRANSPGPRYAFNLSPTPSSKLSPPRPKRPASRASSPRPGLQEGVDDVDDDGSVAARSPGRAPLTPRRMAQSYMNVEDGASQPSRVHTRSPARRVTEDDDDGSLPPDNRGRSPLRQVSQVQLDEDPSMQDFDTTLPNLAIPTFDKKGGNIFSPAYRSEPTETLFTPNPRHESAVDGMTGAGKLRRKGGTPVNYAATHATGSSFSMGVQQPKPRRPLRVDLQTTASVSRENVPTPEPMDWSMAEETPVKFEEGYTRLPPRSNVNRRSRKSSFSVIDGLGIQAGVHTAFSATATATVETQNAVDTGSATIAAMKEQARDYYLMNQYAESIHAYTRAIDFIRVPQGQLSDQKAVLLSNRAAAFMMVGAFEAAAMDCKEGLTYVTKPSTPSDPFSRDSGPPLKVKLLTRLARARLKQGEHPTATACFDAAIDTAVEAIQFSKRMHDGEIFNQNREILEPMFTESKLGKADSSRLRESMQKVSTALDILNSGDEHQNLAEGLGHVTMALSIATGCNQLREAKLKFLATMRRWREVAGFCERIAALNVQFDEVFLGTLETRSPFQGVAKAQFLEANMFGGVLDEDSKSMDLKLPAKAVAEAVLRIPHSFTKYYTRALRLEERYPAAENAIVALEGLVLSGCPQCDIHTLRSRFLWLAMERTKLEKTRATRDRGDELFRLHDFDLAAAQYEACLQIDSDGPPPRGVTAGGRLHAVLHCNRAACFIALRRHLDALDECSAALKIHSRYTKAMLRRARCYQRLQRYEESISQYKVWLELVDEARKYPDGHSSFVTPCNFDGPKDVTDGDINTTKSELEGVYAAKRKAESAAREHASRRQQRQRWDEHMRSNSWNPGAAGPGNAYQRRDEFYNQDHGSRRWDSFSSRGPRSRSQSRPRHDDSDDRGPSSGQSHHHHHRRNRSVGSPGSDQSVDHYTVLEISRSASQEEIKKAYRKMALKYHPDKNNGDESATDKFRRAKLAYETLGDVNARRDYDAIHFFSARRF